MTKNRKILLGIATVSPIFYMFAFFGTMAYVITNNANPDIIFTYLMAVHFLFMILSIVLLVVYIRDILKNDMIPETRKTLWVLLILFGNMIAMPIYWYIFIWKKPNKPIS